MNDKEFRKIITRIIHHLRYREEITDIENSDVLKALQFIRENPNDMKYYDTENIPDDTSEWVSCRWFPGCGIGYILTQIIILLFFSTTFIFLMISVAWCDISFLIPFCTVICP